MSAMPNAETSTTGTVCAAISDSVSRLHKEYTGRGPTGARTVIDGDLVAVTLRGALTRAERRLIDDGKAEFVTRLRDEFHATMYYELVVAVQALSGRTVSALLSVHTIEPDVTVHTYVLDPLPGQWNLEACQ